MASRSSRAARGAAGAPQDDGRTMNREEGTEEPPLHQGPTANGERPPAGPGAAPVPGGSPCQVSVPRRPSEGLPEGPGDEGPTCSLSMVPAYPLMTCYKCFEVDFPYFGMLSGRIEAWVVSSMREQLCHYHRRAIAYIDRW